MRIKYRDPTSVNVEIIAGMASIPPDDDSAGRSRASRDMENFGWYVLCNERTILAADKSERTVWGYSGTPEWHNQYSGFSRLAAQVRAKTNLTPALLGRFSELACEKLEAGDIQARKAYLQTVLDQVEVGDTKIRILADKAALAAAAMGYSEGSTKVRGFERKWRARRDSNS